MITSSPGLTIDVIVLYKPYVTKDSFVMWYVDEPRRLTSVAPTVVVISVKGFKSRPMIGL